MKATLLPFGVEVVVTSLGARTQNNLASLRPLTPIETYRCRRSPKM